MWFNGIGFILAVAMPFLAAEGYTGELPPEIAALVLPATYLVNLVLRYFFTNTGLRA